MLEVGLLCSRRGLGRNSAETPALASELSEAGDWGEAAFAFMFHDYCLYFVHNSVDLTKQSILLFEYFYIPVTCNGLCRGRYPAGPALRYGSSRKP